MFEVKIGDLVLERPVIQGGMGIGVSRSQLAGAVAKAGGMGVISTAQVGYDSVLFLSLIHIFIDSNLTYKIQRFLCTNFVPILYHLQHKLVQI